METANNIELKVQDETKGLSNYITKNLIDCMNFWNNQGMQAIENNLSGKWGNKETNQMAKDMEADDFLLEMLLRDCKVFCRSDFAKNSGDKYECGRTRSHVWVHRNDERILMFHS